MKFYSFHKKHSANGQGEMHWFTSKAEAESKLRIEIKDNPYDEYMRDNVYELSAVHRIEIPTDKKGLLHFLQNYVNIENNQWYPMEEVEQ
tara:strand:- start:84 stop:353 length:270 start_codon:yes stop_codon:yes gene_type:complete